MQVKDIMAAPVKATTANSNAGYLRELMERKKVNSIPIVEVISEKNIKIRGIVTATDLRGQTDESIKAEDIMTKNVHVVSPELSAQAAAKMMLQHEIHHLVVMHEGVVVGMLSALDFVRLVAERSKFLIHL